MAKTLLFNHPVCAEHDPGARHPESGARLRAIEDALAAEPFAALERREPPPATPETLAWAHDRALVDAILANVPEDGRVAIDADTAMSPASGEAARRAAGAVTAAVDAVLGGEADNAFCAVRPPGHHAEPKRPMGFCLFNNVAIGAEHARRAHGLTRIAVVDFDVHHGNGTQAAFERDGDLFFGSTHQSPLYPGTGAASETGVGNIVNAPLSPGTGSAGFRDAMESRLLPALRTFRPELILDLGRLRCAPRRPAGEPRARRGGLCLDHDGAHPARRRALRRPCRLDPRRRLRPARAGRERRGPCRGADGGGVGRP